MMPLLPRCVLGMPLILLVHVVGMSKNASTQILGLTKINYSTPRIKIKIQNKSQSITNQIILYKGSLIITYNVH